MTERPAPAATSASWVVVRPRGRPRWGSEVRRRAIFEVLARRTNARVVPFWTLLDRRGNGIPLRWLRRPRGGERAVLAASEQPPVRAQALVETWTRPLAVAVYDDPVAQSRAFGVPLDEARTAELRARLDLSSRLFERLVVPTASFADLIGLPPGRVIVAGNGTNTSRIQPGPWPSRPVVGMVSGAAAGRGIELLVDAVAALRPAQPDVVLRLWLVATSPASEAWLAEFRRRTSDRPWIEIEALEHDDLGPALATATVLCVPHPANAYMDAALPVKLLDSLAAGRPVVVTPRTETAAIVRRHGAGMVARGDTAEDLAAAIDPLLAAPDLAGRLGDAARLAAVADFDWEVVGARLADTLLACAGDPPPVA